jgi:hypothetical protein
LRKATINFVMPARLPACPPARLPACPRSVSIEQLGSVGRDGFLWYLIIFRKAFEKFRVSLKSDKNSGYITWSSTHLFIRSSSIVLKIINVSDKFVEEMKSRFMFSNFLLSKIVPLWHNVEKYCRAGQATDNNTAHGYLRLKYTLRICNTYCCPLQQWLHERTSMLRYTYIACLIMYKKLILMTTISE